MNMHIKNFIVPSILFITLSYLLSSCGACDGIAFTLTKVFEQQASNDLNTSFANLIDKNTEILSDCSIVGYTNSNQSDLHEWLQDYGIERYDVTYECDILSFSVDLYRLENKFYTLDYGLGPCGEKNVYFNDSSENRLDAWYSTKYSLEYDIIRINLKDPEFCTKLDKKINGEETNQCK